MDAMTSNPSDKSEHSTSGSEELVDKFLDAIWMERGLSSNTLGAYRAEFYTQNNGILASIEDTDGVVDLAGSLQINQDKSYVFLGQLVAKTNTPDALLQRIRYLPEGDRPGQRELRLEGSY